MAIIKSVTNGSGTAVFKAVSLGHVVAIVFGLTSIIGAQQTWLWAGAHEREMIVASIRNQITTDLAAHSNVEDRRFDQFERRLSIVEEKLDEAQKQINVNTGIIGTMKR